jgi:hypothetical protein
VLAVPEPAELLVGLPAPVEPVLAGAPTLGVLTVGPLEPIWEMTWLMMLEIPPPP